MLLAKIENTIKKYNLIKPHDIIVVAVSGGPDSMCLLDSLLKLKKKLQIDEIAVAHLNHMLRDEATNETQYVEEYCKKNNIKFFCKYVDINKISKTCKIGTEEAGRIERYAFFDEVVKEVNANKIAIAHNKKDNCETVLMHMMRGSGLAGLSGIKPFSQNYIRPLIDCSRDEIEKYCEENKLNPKFDKSNNDNTYTRNRIRNELIPYIEKEFNPNIVDTLKRLSEVVQDTEEYMKKITNNAIQSIVIEKNENNIVADLKKFNSLEKIIKSRIILEFSNSLLRTTKGIEKVNIEDIIKLCSNNIGNKFIMPNKNFKVLVNNGKIYFGKSNLK